MMLRVRGDVTGDQLRIALDKIRVRHLALVPGFALDKPHETLFAFSVLTDRGDHDWIDVAQAEQRNEFWPASGPFARFTVLRRASGFDIVATFHHQLCDGMSGLFVLRDLLQALGEPDVELTPLAAPPPADTLIPESYSTDPRFRLKVAVVILILRMRAQFERLKKRIRFRPQAGFFQPQEASAQEYVILPALLSLEQTAALVARCKKEQVSVHAALCMAWLQALAGEPSGGKRHGKVSSPLNTRKRLSSPIDDTSGLFMSVVETRVACKPDDDFWPLAREFHRKFKNDTRDESVFSTPLMLKEIFTQLSQADLGELMPVFLNRPSPYDFSITNLGRVSVPQINGSLQAEAFYGPLVNTSPHERTVGISTFAERMSLSFVFRKSLMDAARGQALMDRALGWVTNS